MRLKPLAVASSTGPSPNNWQLAGNPELNRSLYPATFAMVDVLPPRNRALGQVKYLCEILWQCSCAKAKMVAVLVASHVEAEALVQGVVVERLSRFPRKLAPDEQLVRRPGHKVVTLLFLPRVEVAEADVFRLLVRGARFSEDDVESLNDVALAAIVATNDYVLSLVEPQVKLTY